MITPGERIITNIVPVLVAAALVLAFIPVALYRTNRTQTRKPAEVKLQAIRGAGEEARARRSLVLNMDVSTLTRLSWSTRVAKIIWRQTVEARAWAGARGYSGSKREQVFGARVHARGQAPPGIRAASGVAVSNELPASAIRSRQGRTDLR
jgi:hypothetical protein